MSLSRGKYCLIHLENYKPDFKNEIITLKFFLKQDNVVPHPRTSVSCLIRLQLKISFVTSFTISKWLEKYYFKFLAFIWNNKKVLNINNVYGIKC